MVVSVRLSSALAQAAGNARLAVRLDSGATVAALLDRLCVDYPSLTEKLNNTVAVISGQTVPRSQPLADGEEVAILIPISGG